MSNISKNSGTNVGIELSSIAVAGENGGRGECWKFNISNQFPIINPNIENGKVVLDVDSPHKGYSIQTVMENGKMSGESRILNEKNVKVASLVFVDGVANGPCKLYDNKGTIFFEGYFVNGYREGKGKEYDEKGNVVYEGFFEQGRRMNIVELKEMKGYWKEMNDANEVISICQKDDECRNDGICYFYSNGNIDRISEWKNGEEISDSGYCRIFDEPNKVFFEGYFENGKREGKGKEFDLNGKVVFDGLYRNGKRTNMVVVKEMKGYWKEMNDDNEVISICKKNEKNENDGICYFYSNGKIDKVSEWKNGEELNVLKRFEGNKMIEFVNGVKRYEGEFRDSIKHNYPREGEGEEYDTDGKSLVYEGQFWNNKRQGKGKLYRNGDVVYDGKWIMGYRLGTVVLSSIVTLIVLIALVIVLLRLSFYMGLVLLGIDVVFFLVLGICYRSVLFHKKQNSKDKKAQNSVITDRKCNRFIYWILGGIIFNILFVLISIIIQQIILRLYLGPYSQTSIVVPSGSCNSILVTAFSVGFYRNLESIEIGDHSFHYVMYFKISGLKHLKSIKIGDYSFNFIFSSFEIKGIIDMILLMNRSSTFEFHYIR